MEDLRQMRHRKRTAQNRLQPSLSVRSAAVVAGNLRPPSPDDKITARSYSGIATQLETRRSPMRTAKNGVLLLVLAFVAAMSFVSSAGAAVSCHKINAKGVGQDLGGGTTRAQIIGGGLLHGVTQGHFVVSGGAPPALAISGTVTFTTAQATLTVTVAGTFNVATGAFIATGPVTAATGKLAGATGTLVLDGLEDLTSGAFAEDVTGVVCVDLAP